MKISRTYSRSASFKKPDGMELWIRHEATADDEVDAARAHEAFEVLEGIVVSEVATAVRKERDAIQAALFPKVDEPFPGTPINQQMKDMPKL